MVKIDIFKEVLYYQYEPERGRSIVMPLNPDEVRRIKSMNERGEYPDDIVASESENQIDKVVEQGYSDVTGAVELPNEKRKKRKKKKPGQNARQESKVDSSNEGSVQDREPRKLTVTPKSKDPQITTEGSEKNLVVNKQNVQNREQSKQVQNPPKKIRFRFLCCIFHSNQILICIVILITIILKKMMPGIVLIMKKVNGLCRTDCFTLYAIRILNMRKVLR